MHPETAKCPKCDRRVTYRDVATAFYPVWLKCKGCDAKLIGSRFVKIQGVLIPIISVGIGVGIAVRPGWDEMSYAAAFIALIFAGLMVLATVRYGRYYLRASGGDAINQGNSNHAESDPME